MITYFTHIIVFTIQVATCVAYLKTTHAQGPGINNLFIHESKLYNSCLFNEVFHMSKYEGKSIYKSQMAISLISFVHYAFTVCQQMAACVLVVEVVSDRLGTRLVSGSQSTMAGVLHECT